MNNNKPYIILFSIVIIFTIFMFLLFGRENIRLSKNELTLLTGEKTAWVYSKKTWNKVSNVNAYNWKKFNTYLNGKFVGNNYVWHDDKWYIFDENKNAINYTENMIAVNANFDLKTKQFTIVENEGIDRFVAQVMKNNNVSYDDELTNNYKAIVDIDSDGKDEYIYVVSNIFPIYSEHDFYFSYVFMVKDEDIYEIDKQKFEGDAYSGQAPYLHTILDANNDGNFDILLSFEPYSVETPIYRLYQFDGKNFIKAVSDD